jgi:hypothetical protein
VVEKPPVTNSKGLFSIKLKYRSGFTSHKPIVQTKKTSGEVSWIESYELLSAKCKTVIVCVMAALWQSLPFVLIK